MKSKSQKTHSNGLYLHHKYRLSHLVRFIYIIDINGQFKAPNRKATEEAKEVLTFNLCQFFYFLFFHHFIIYVHEGSKYSNGIQINKLKYSYKHNYQYQIA